MAYVDADIEYAIEQMVARQAEYARYRRYAEGKHDLKFASSTFRDTFAHLFRHLSYNKCAPVINAFADRLIVTGWENENAPKDAPNEAGASKRDPIEQAAIDLWKANTMPTQQHEVHAEALQEGISYVIVWPDPETNIPVFAPNTAERVFVLFNDDNPSLIDVAVKAWRVDRGEDKGRWRLTIYDDEQVTRFISRSKGKELPKKIESFGPYEDDSPPEVPNQWGICPVVPFRNNPTVGGLGVSELRDIIPLQDGLNKSVADGLVGAEYQAFRQRYVTGLEPEYDPETGKEIPRLISGVDRVWQLPNGSTAGDFEAADLTQYTAAQDSWETKIARTSNIPVHWLTQTGSFPSGESLKTAEDPFVKKGEKQQGSFGNSHAAVMRLGLIQQGYAPEDVAGLTPIWKPMASRSDLEFWQIAQGKLAAGVSAAQVQAEYGYTPDEIAEFATAAQAEAEQQAERDNILLNRGQLPGTQGL